MIRKILRYPDRILEGGSRSVDYDKDPGMVNELVVDLLDTMADCDGVGLSAIQIGVPLTVFVMEANGTDYVFINATALEFHGKKELMNESCLAVPGLIEQIERYPGITVAARDRNGNPFRQKFTGIEAQIIQHEMNHGMGILLTDKMKNSVLEAYLKGQKDEDSSTKRPTPGPRLI